MKKRIIAAFALLSLLLTLASCGTENNYYQVVKNDEKTVLTTTDSKSTKSYSEEDIDEKIEPIYVHYDVDINTTVDNTKKDVEETVEYVYGSVVSIIASNSTSIAAGSGVLFTYSNEYNKSFIVTCFHVIEDFTSFSVTYNNNTVDESDDITYEAKLVGGYKDSDLAVLSIDALDLVYADIYEDSSSLKLGSTVLCIGNPLGSLPGSVSKGIVSYVNRKINVDTYQTMSLIQTDVAINSGNSGGGLFNTAGALIGIVNAKYSSSGIEGLGFAIPSSEVIRVINELINNSSYDIANNEWSYGYVIGDYEFGFNISYYAGGFNQSGAIYISSVSNDNPTYTGDELKENYIISKITINYIDGSVDSYQIANPSSNELTSINNFLYNSNLELGDKIIVTYKDGTNVSFLVEQFIYSI